MKSNIMKSNKEACGKLSLPYILCGDIMATILLDGNHNQF